MKKALLTIAIALSSAYSAWAQQVQRCNSMDHLQGLQAADPALVMKMIQQEAASDAWINAQPAGSQHTVINIPVVFHILYHDSTQNLGDNVIYSQLEVINEDYRRQNADSGQTPLPFRPLAADCEIQFCLAQRTPLGLPTNGIIHKYTTVTAFHPNEYEFTKYSNQGGDDSWDASKYLNVWVAAFSSNTFLGIGTFPNIGPQSSDGVVINYKACGRIGNHLMSHYNKGRSLTHEIGHWLNLKHIWGDDGYDCIGEDDVSDTPKQTGENYGCPAYPKTDSCSSSYPGVMFMNFMDYTDDGCMNIFTQGQKMRMLSALNLERVSILTSDGCLAVGITENDIMKHVSLFPNPAENGLTLKSDKIGISGFEMVNMVGESVMTSAYVGTPLMETTIDISTLSPGIYFMRIYADGGSAVFKVIKR